MPHESFKLEPLDHASDVPLYLQLSEQIREAIRLRLFDENEPLPKEVDISQALGVSRSVVRQAILKLVADGHLYRVSGKGTFLAYPKAEYDLFGFYNFKGEMERQGRTLTFRLIDFDILPADAKNAALFGIGHGEDLAVVRRVLLVDEIPFLVERTTIPRRYVPGLTREEAANDAFGKIFGRSGVSLTSAKKYLEPAIADPVESKLLDITSGMPVLLIDRYTYGGEQNQVVARCKWTVRGDKCRYYISINSQNLESF